MKVSVITIFLNAEEFIKEAIESVLSQTSNDWELLLVDDGSTDKSTLIATQYAQQFPDKIHYLEHHDHRNQGMSASRNLGLKNARGQYMAFLDADDIFLPQKLEKQSHILDTHLNAAMVYGPTFYWYGWTGQVEDIKRDRITPLGIAPNACYQPNKLMILYLSGNYIPCMCGCMVRTKALQNVGNFEESFKDLFEDQVFFAKIVLNYPVCVDAGVWDKYRQHPNSICGQAKIIQANKVERSPIDKMSLIYYKWLEQYISNQKIRDKNLNKALKRHLNKYKFSHQCKQYIKSVIKKLIGLIKS